MKFMIALSALAAVATAQVPYPGVASGIAAGPYATAYASVNAYAPAFGYATHGVRSNDPVPAAVPTALDVFKPYAPVAAPAAVAAPAFYNYGYNANAYAYNPHNSFYSPYNSLYNGFYNYAAPAATYPVAASSPAVAVATANAAVEAPVEEEVEVIEADATPVKPDGPVFIRQIFPIFGSDLRGGSEEIVFARPDQINPVKPEQVGEVATELPGVIVPNFGRSFAALPAAPAGIVQATQPRFYYNQPAVQANQVISF